ncbi:MAG TPA: 3-oxoadipate enol-lactonase [Polyangiales bacterium]|nr:3-oxoadipate enol-lactonase [Polyangiales bacterium]
MNSVIVNHRVEGPAAAPALLLINSIGSDLSIWEPILPELLRHFRVIRYDQRGHGASPVPSGPYQMSELAADALALLDRLGVQRAHVAGTSLGGMVGLWLAVHAPERVERLAVICSSARLGPPEAWRERAALVRAQGSSAVAQAGVGRWFTPQFAQNNPAAIARYEAMVSETPAEGYAACCEAIARWDITAELTKISAPTWILSAQDDPATPPAHGYLMAGLIPGARIDVVAGAAHLALAERPAFVGRLLVDHLLGHPDSSPAPDPERAKRGERVRREVLGDAHVDRAKANTTPLTAPFQDLITRYAWGEIWSRPGLTRAERSIVTLSVLAAMQHEEELAMHIRAALRNGLTVSQIQEVLLQVGLYAGVPVANRAFAVAKRVLEPTDD